MRGKYRIKLEAKERKELKDLIKKGKSNTRKLTRARIMLLVDKGKKIKTITENLDMVRNTVYEICRKYEEGGLQAAINDKPRSGAPRKYTGTQRAKITALACSTPPEGYQRWSLRLLADKSVELQLVESISYKTVERLLKKTS